MQQKLITRNTVRARGYNYSAEQFRRWERAGLLTVHKADGKRSARVYYPENEVIILFAARPKKH